MYTLTMTIVLLCCPVFPLSLSPPHGVQYYVKDSFGLQTLDKAGKVKVFQVAGVEHTHWHGNKTVFDTCIEPYLT